MKNDIYDLLNDIDNQIDTFETVDITSTDLKNWKQSFALKKKTSVKKHTWKKYAAAAAAFIILLGGSSAPVRQNVYAQSQQIMESLSTLLGTKEDLSPYSTVVGKSISKNGITITSSPAFLKLLLIHFFVSLLAFLFASYLLLLPSRHVFLLPHEL